MGAKVTVFNRKGDQVFHGTTPATIFLKSGAGFFKSESYKIRFELDGNVVREVPLQCSINGWYWGNILLGGVLGTLIIDPATGAMYKPNTKLVSANLTKGATGDVLPQSGLKILNRAHIPDSVAAQLVRINQASANNF